MFSKAHRNQCADASDFRGLWIGPYAFNSVQGENMNLKCFTKEITSYANVIELLTCACSGSLAFCGTKLTASIPK